MFFSKTGLHWGHCRGYYCRGDATVGIATVGAMLLFIIYFCKCSQLCFLGKAGTVGQTDSSNPEVGKVRFLSFPFLENTFVEKE